MNLRQMLAVAVSTLLACQVIAQETKLYWGDTHLHTSYSPDAYALQTYEATPDTSYRFAKGLPAIADLARSRVQIETPLDFLVVTDHAEFMGVLPELAQGNPDLMAIKVAAKWKQWLDEGRGGDVFFELLQTAIYDKEALSEINSETIRRTVWEKIVDAAERHNSPGEFTTFVGWEWSSLIEGRNLHRVVFTPDGKDKAMEYLPFSFLQSAKPQDLWSWLTKTAEDYDTDFVAIPHNMNISGGSMFPLKNESGESVDAEYARQRMRWEPIAEVTQYKGDSETHAKLSPQDPFADFENYEKFLDPTSKEAPEPKIGDYARTALMRGLKLESSLGVNPYQFGMIGATDSHTGFSSAEEGNFLGKYSMDSIPENKSKTTVPGAVGWDAQAGGLAGVWATENTRQAIFDAFKRKEVYATTGPRIGLRVFAGYDFKKKDAKSVNLAAIGYKKGVPMGGELGPPTGEKSPRLLIHAAKDPKSANLERAQVVKGWLSADGNVHEKVFDVVLTRGRLGAKVPSGENVNVEQATFTNDIGKPSLATVWIDPEFDPTLRAFYYVRVLEIPTPRHSVYDALALNVDVAETKHPAIIQERVYSSPIWYTP